MEAYEVIGKLTGAEKLWEIQEEAGEEEQDMWKALEDLIEDGKASTWGLPKEINKTTYAWGITEQWVYSGYRYNQ